MPRIKVTESYFKYWGKAEKDGDGYHLLPYHSFDEAAEHQLIKGQA